MGSKAWRRHLRGKQLEKVVDCLKNGRHETRYVVSDCTCERDEQGNDCINIKNGKVRRGCGKNNITIVRGVRVSMCLVMLRVREKIKQVLATPFNCLYIEKSMFLDCDWGQRRGLELDKAQGKEIFPTARRVHRYTTMCSNNRERRSGRKWENRN